MDADKSIIIDGCNVAECEHRISCLNDNNDVQCKIGIYRDDDVIIIPICKDNPDCYFKQLQRLKDKLEKISYRFKQTKKANKQYKTDIKNLQAENEKLKAENEHLAEKEEEARHYLNEAYKYKQALVDIKVDFINHSARNGINKFENEIFIKIDKLLST